MQRTWFLIVTIWKKVFKRIVLCTSSKKLFHFRVLSCLNDYVVDFVKGRLPNANTHQRKSKIQLSSSFLYSQVCWIVFFFEGELLECLKLTLKLQELGTFDPQLFFKKIEEHLGVANLRFFIVGCSKLGRWSPSFSCPWKRNLSPRRPGFFSLLQ